MIDLATARGLLDADRERTRRRLDRLLAEHTGFVEASRDTNADDEHDPEGTTIAFERSQVGALVRQARARLDDIAAATDRLGDGDFGRCTVCGEEIADERLAARPTAVTCVGCA